MEQNFNYEGFVVCDYCQSKGYFYLITTTEFGNYRIGINHEVCPLCNGSGIVNWIDNILKNCRILSSSTELYSSINFREELKKIIDNHKDDYCVVVNGIRLDGTQIF